MNKISRPLLISGLFTSMLLISACSPKDHSEQNNGSEPKDASQEILDQIQSKPVKSFPSTPDDAHDIQLLNQYTQNDEENMRAIDADLQQRAKDGNLTDEMNTQLKRDAIQSSLNMLKELDLKTEQGRYIQGLFYQYWENQVKIEDKSQSANAGESKTSTDMSAANEDLANAQNQLDFWQSKTTSS